MGSLDALYPLSTTRVFMVIPCIMKLTQRRGDPIIKPSNDNMLLREDLSKADPFVRLKRVSTIIEHGAERMG